MVLVIYTLLHVEHVPGNVNCYLSQHVLGTLGNLGSDLTFEMQSSGWLWFSASSIGAMLHDNLVLLHAT